MSSYSWLQNLRSDRAPGRGQRKFRQRDSLRAATHRPSLEALGSSFSSFRSSYMQFDKKTSKIWLDFCDLFACVAGIDKGLEFGRRSKARRTKSNAARCGFVAANALEMIGWSRRSRQRCQMLYWKSDFATAILLLSLPTADASSLPAYHFAGDVLFNLSPPDRLSPNDFGSFSLTDGRFGSVSLSAFGMSSPSIVASADIGTGVIPIIFGRGAGILTYSFEIVGPSGVVPVLIDVAGAISGSATPGASFALASSWDLFDPGHVRLAGDDIRSGQLSGEFNQNFSHNLSLSLAANQVYSVSMLADASSAATDLGSHAIANAFIDPMFSFGPGVDPLSYSFSFSDGIGNAALAGVPEPGTLVLLSAGLLSLGLLRLLSARKPQIDLTEAEGVLSWPPTAKVFPDVWFVLHPSERRNKAA